MMIIYVSNPCSDTRMVNMDDVCWMTMKDDEGATPLRIPLTRWRCASDVCPGRRPSETLVTCLKERRQIRFAKLGEDWIIWIVW